MDSKMNERLLSKIHLDRLLSDESRKEELISIVAFYFAQHPNTKNKWEGRYNAEIKSKANKTRKGKHETKKENIISIVPDDTTE